MCRPVIAGTVCQDKYRKAECASHDWSEHVRRKFDTDIKGDNQRNGSNVRTILLIGHLDLRYFQYGFPYHAVDNSMIFTDKLKSTLE